MIAILEKINSITHRVHLDMEAVALFGGSLLVALILTFVCESCGINLFAV
ncbi:MAG: hypothetical protein R3C61_27060 [Bacteroidia bacterium]